MLNANSNPKFYSAAHTSAFDWSDDAATVLLSNQKMASIDAILVREDLLAPLPTDRSLGELRVGGEAGGGLDVLSVASWSVVLGAAFSVCVCVRTVLLICAG